MPGTKISDLTTRSVLQPTDYLVVADGDEGLNYKIPFQDLGANLMPTYQKELDEVSSSISYLGEAIPGTLSSAPNWRIQKIVITAGDISIKFADTGNFSQIWNNRLSLSYT